MSFLKKIWKKIKWVYKIKNYFYSKINYLHFILKQEPKAKVPWKIVATLFTTLWVYFIYFLIINPMLFFEISDYFNFNSPWTTDIIISMIEKFFTLFIVAIWTFIIYLISFGKDIFFPKYYILLSILFLILPFILIKILYGSIIKWKSEFINYILRNE